MQLEMKVAIGAVTVWVGWMLTAFILARRLEHWVFRTGEFRRALWWIRRTRALHFACPQVFEYTEFAALEYRGLTRTLLRWSPRLNHRGLWRLSLINARVNLMITAGRYREALELAAAAVEPAVPTTLGPLISVNASEALYNLGRWDEAWNRLEGLDDTSDALTTAGLLNQRCWIMAHTGRSQEALELHAQVIRAALPHVFHAEHHFTAAALLLGVGRFDDAFDEAELGRSLSDRASSKRNAVFLLARIEMARGNLVRAEALFRQGSRHRYQGQGGDALLAWGDCLQRLGRETEARFSWGLCAKRDPQSAAAITARLRLESGATAPNVAERVASPAPGALATATCLRCARFPACLGPDGSRRLCGRCLREAAAEPFIRAERLQLLKASGTTVGVMAIVATFATQGSPVAPLLVIVATAIGFAFGVWAMVVASSRAERTPMLWVLALNVGAALFQIMVASLPPGS